MGKFKEGDNVSYRSPKVYIGNGKSVTTNARSGSAKWISSSSSGVKVEKEDGSREFIHRNRITN